MDKLRNINGFRRDPRAFKGRPRARRAEPPAAAPQDSGYAARNAAETASPAIIIHGGDPDHPPHPPPPSFHYPDDLASPPPPPQLHSKTSSPAVAIQSHPPPTLPPVPCAPPPSLSSSPPPLNPQLSASATPKIRTAPPAIFIDLNDPNESAAWHNLVIFEALSTLNNPTGCSIGDIANSVKERHGVPENFRRSLSSKVEDLVSLGKLEAGRQWGPRNFRKSLSSKLQDVKLEMEQKYSYKIKKVQSPTRSEHRAYLAAKAFQEAKKFETMKAKSRKGRRDGYTN